jgi:hypothetical protein
MENKTLADEIKNFFKDPKKRLYGSIAFTIITIVLVGATIAFVNNSRYESERSLAKQVTDQAKNDILANVLKNNSLEVTTKNNIEHEHDEEDDHAKLEVDYVQIDPTTGLPINRGNGEPTNPVAIDLKIYPDLTKYNYRTTNIKTTPGPQKDACKFYSYVSDEIETAVTTELFTRNYAYYKTEKNNQSDVRTGYFMSKYGVDVNQTYNYAGGDYGIVSKYQPYWYGGEDSREIISSPVSSPKDTANIVNSYFSGQNSVNRVITTNGKKFFEFINKFTIDCNAVYGCGGGNMMAGLVEPRSLDIVNLYLVDGETFEIVSTEYYLNTIDSSNLIFRKEASVKTQLVEASTATSQFDFPTDITLKNLDYTTANYSTSEYVSRLNQHIASAGYKILMPDTTQIGLSRVNAKNIPPSIPGADYIRDRKYYQPGPVGDKLFNKVQEYYGPYNPLLTSGYSNIYGGITLHQFESGADVATLIKHSTSSNYQQIVRFQTTLKIEGQDVSVEGIEYRYPAYNYNVVSLPVSEPTSFPVSYSVNEKFYDSSALPSYPVSYPHEQYYYISYTFIFEYKGVVYQVWADGQGVNNLNVLNFSIKDAADVSDRENIFGEINKAYLQ